MKMNLAFFFKIISLILIIISFFMPIHDRGYPENFYINNLYNYEDSNISFFTYYFIVVALIIFIGVVIDFIHIKLNLINKIYKLFSLFVAGSYLTLSSFFLFDLIYVNSLNIGFYYKIMSALYLIISSALFYLLSFFFISSSNKLRNDKKIKTNPIPYEQLSKLKKLFDDQVLTEEEYIHQKKILMEK